MTRAASAAGISFNPPETCRPTTSNVFPASRSGSISPTQRMGVSPAARTARTFRFAASSVSAKNCRRSEWPMMQWVAPASVSIRVETSPVNAPSSAKWTFWDATPIALPLTSCATAPIDRYGGARTISTPRASDTSGRKARTKAAASPAVLYIFQLPAMTGTRIALLRRGDVLRQVDQSAGVPPLVVVPGEHLRHLPADHLRGEGVEGGRGRIVVEIDRDERLVHVLEDPLHGPLGGLLHRRVDLFRRGARRQLRRQVHHGNIRRGDADRHPVELSLQLGDDERDGLGGSSGRRDHRHPRGARPAQVLVRQAEDLLVVRVGVDRRHQAALDPEAVEQHLGDRGEAVRGAGSVGEDEMLPRVERLLVHAHDEGGVLPLRRGGDDHALRAGGDVLPRAVPVRVSAGGLDDDLDPQLAPRQIGGVLAREDPDLLAVHHDGVFLHLDGRLEAAVHGVVLQEVGQGLRVGDVVHGHDLERGILVRGAEEVAADPPEPVDADFDGHIENLLRGNRMILPGKEDYTPCGSSVNFFGYIMIAPRGRSPHFSPGFVARWWRRAWIQGARPRAPEA